MNAFRRTNLGASFAEPFVKYVDMALYVQQSRHKISVTIGRGSIISKMYIYVEWQVLHIVDINPPAKIRR